MNEIVFHDGRGARKKPSSSLSLATFKCVQWNIERGYKLDRVIALLKEHHADIIMLQELDVGCERSGRRDCVKELANALGMKCAFMTEFQELHSHKRTPTTQGGGLHGNAILSRFDFEPFVVPHTHHPVVWEVEGERLREPRIGERAILGARVHAPGMDKPIICFNLHLEVFCGIPGRIRQFADCLDSARKNLSESPYQLIFGDLNTCHHGLARMSQRCAQQSIRFKTFGYSEAAWWTKNIFQRISEPEKDTPSSELLNLTTSGLIPVGDINRLINPYFYDPFCVNSDTTFQTLRGLYMGKLDWTLLRGFRTLGRGFDNKDYNASDHALLYVIIRPIPSEECGGNDPGPVAFKEHPRTRVTVKRKFSGSAIFIAAAIAGVTGFLLGSVLLRGW